MQAETELIFITHMKRLIVPELIFITHMTWNESPCQNKNHLLISVKKSRKRNNLKEATYGSNQLFLRFVHTNYILWKVSLSPSRIFLASYTDILFLAHVIGDRNARMLVVPEWYTTRQGKNRRSLAGQGL